VLGGAYVQAFVPDFELERRAMVGIWIGFGAAGDPPDRRYEAWWVGMGQLGL
jgi:hypothetical protein